MSEWSYNYDYLCHHGVQGQKWGIRRYQNADGSLTPEGKARYGVMSERTEKAKNKFGAIAKGSAAATGAIVAYDVAALAAGASSILLPIGPAAVLIGSGAAYVSSVIANQHANKKLQHA